MRIPLLTASIIRQKLLFEDKWCFDHALGTHELFQKKPPKTIPLSDDVLSLVMQKLGRNCVAKLSSISQDTYFRVGSNLAYWKRFAKKLNVLHKLETPEHRHPAYPRELVENASRWIVPYSEERAKFYKRFRFLPDKVTVYSNFLRIMSGSAGLCYSN
uniref:Uncharacterized protein n=1 Tax=Clandestinovirus TaxID=2831644 RepID=A0A8F8KLL1_9VIRU|nr:hypothetical protein KOM_12_87 [Clandestinovirus]